MEYHVLIVPYFPWETAGPKTFNDLIKLIRVSCRLFGFRSIPTKNEEPNGLRNIMTSPEKTPKALLSWRLPHMIHEVGLIRNITEMARKKAQEQFDILKIEEAYASDFAIEIISSTIDIFWRWREDFQFDQLAKNLSDFLYEMDKTFPGAVSVVVCRIILCDDFSELETIAKEFKLNEIEKGLYVGGENTPVKYNMFNFIIKPWNDVFISNPIATLKPESLRSQGYHKTVDELSFLLSMIHSLGKFYTISESIKGVLASLEWASWYLDDLFDKFESDFCWLQRNFTGIEKHLRKIEKDIKSEVFPLSKITISPESVNLIERVYGVEYLPHVGEFLSILKNFRIEKYKIPTDEISKSTLNDLKLLSRGITRFWKEFSDARDSWKELRRSKVTNNQLILALLGVLSTLVVNILLKLF